MQRPERPAVPAMFVGRLRLPQRVLAVEESPGLHLGVDLVDALEAGVDQLDRRDAALADIGRGIAQRECGEAHGRDPRHTAAPHRGVYR